MDMKKAHVNLIFFYPCWWVEERNYVIIRIRDNY